MGKTEVEVSEIGFGVLTLASGCWGTFTDDQAVDLLRKAYDAGINYFDVAPTDGNGRGERLLGQAFGDKRELVIISSKAGRSESGADFSPTSIRKSLDGTLERLGSSYVDALQLHYPDAATVANPAVWQTLEDLKAEGKIRYYGIALGPGPGGLEEGRAAMRKHDLGCIQTYYNLLEEEPGRKFFPVALEIAQGMVTRAPHAGGVLESDADAVKFPADGDLRTKEATWIERARRRQRRRTGLRSRFPRWRAPARPHTAFLTSPTRPPRRRWITTGSACPCCGPSKDTCIATKPASCFLPNRLSEIRKIRGSSSSSCARCRAPSSSFLRTNRVAR